MSVCANVPISGVASSDWPFLRRSWKMANASPFRFECIFRYPITLGRQGHHPGDAFFGIAAGDQRGNDCRRLEAQGIAIGAPLQAVELLVGQGRRHSHPSLDIRVRLRAQTQFPSVLHDLLQQQDLGSGLWQLHRPMQVCTVPYNFCRIAPRRGGMMGSSAIAGSCQAATARTD